MGKKHKHSKDKLYNTVTELKSHHIGANRDLELSILHRRLKFDTCCLSLNSVNIKPMGLCDEDGYCYVFECDLIVKFLEKFQIHPITGRKVSVKDLIELKFHKNNEDQYHCPVIYKLFNQLSKIIVNKKTGNVYSFEAYQQLNFKPNNFNDLLTDEPFDKSDIKTIQDPSVAETKWKVSDFHYIKNKLKVEDETNGNRIRDIDQSAILKTSLEEYKSKASSIVETFNRIVGQDNPNSCSDSSKLDNINSAVYSDGALSSSVTSTIAPIASTQRAALLSDDQILYPRIKSKGYIQMLTNFGPLNLELYCNRTPKTCHNFFLLASRGYYDNTCFHRLIKNFILQGGDPTGTGSGGQSAWGEPFKDECHGDLKHEGRGVLSMANSGANTNKSQFYITFRGVWDHLDGKHTVFGRVVGGDDTLDRIESVEVDKIDRPKKEIKILRMIKYVDPFEEAEKLIEKERKRPDDGGRKLNGSDNREKTPKRFRSGVGAYIDLSKIQGSGGRQQQKEKSLMKNEQQVEMENDESAHETTNCGGSTATNGNASEAMATSLSGKLAALKDTKKGNKSFGDFSSW